MQAQTDRLQQRYDFDSWNVPRGPTSIAWGFRLGGNELPGWKPHRIQQVDLPGQPPASLSVWRPTQGNGTLLAVNVYECDDESAARRYLLRLLGEFQGPDLQRVASPGEVAFAAGSAGLLFARGNLVALVRSIERTPAPVAESAGRLDDVLAGNIPETRDGPSLDQLAAEPGTGASIPLSIKASGAAGDPVWFHLRSETGRLALLNRQPTFTPEGAGPHAVRVTAVSATGTTTDTLRIGSNPPPSS